MKFSKVRWLVLSAMIFTMGLAQPSSEVSKVELQTTLQGHAGTVLSLALSPDGKTLAAGVGRNNLGSVVAFWDYSNGRKKRIYYPWLGHKQFYFPSIKIMAFSPDSRKLVMGLVNVERFQLDTIFELRVLDTTTGHEWHQSETETSAIECVAFSPDGTMVASGNWRGEARIFNAESGKDIKRFPSNTLGSIRGVTFSPDNMTLATANGSGG